MTYHLLITIDVEDWFQVENFKQYIPFSSWPSYELRVEKNTHHILNLLDSVKLQPSVISYQLNNDRQPTTDDGHTKRSPKATFFVLGWIAERLPHLVREIHSRGHEVASHGYSHNLCSECSIESLKADLTKSKKLLEDIIGAPVFGYRAPSFSINHDILQIIKDCGYLYDSSYNSFPMHGRYGHLDLSQNGRRGIALQIPRTNHQSSIVNRQSSIFFELPISNLNVRNPFSYACPVKFLPRSSGRWYWGFKKDSKAVLSAGSVGDLTGVLSAISSEQNRGGFVLPWGGGAYFRLTPFPLFKLGVQSILKKQNAYLFYCHPWEIDPEQPRVRDASAFYRFRHYTNLSKTHSKLLKLLENFAHYNFITCSQYLNAV